MKKTAAVLLFLVAVINVLCASDLKSVLPGLNDSELGDLRNGVKVSATSWETDISEYAPVDSMMKRQAVTNSTFDDSWSESVTMFVPYPEYIRSMTRDERHVYVYNILRSISTMKGITYISHSAGDKPAVLFKESYVISDPSNPRSRVKDPVSASVPRSSSLSCYQKDSKFGGNVYYLDYVASGNEIVLAISNHTPLKFLGVTCLPEGMLYMYVGVSELDDGFLVYSMATVFGQPQQVKVLVTTVDLPSAFTKRITSLGEWFEGRIKK